MCDDIIKTFTNKYNNLGITVVIKKEGSKKALLRVFHVVIKIEHPDAPDQVWESFNKDRTSAIQEAIFAAELELTKLLPALHNDLTR